MPDRDGDSDRGSDQRWADTEKTKAMQRVRGLRTCTSERRIVGVNSTGKAFSAIANLASSGSRIRRD